MAEEASADMRVFARQMRDMYVALVAEGFTAKEALTMIGQTLAAVIDAAMKKGGSPGGG